MEKVYLISTCIEIQNKYSIFHFIGYFKGAKIKKIYIMNNHFEIGKEYLIKANLYKRDGNNLYGEAVKYKIL